MGVPACSHDCKCLWVSVDGSVGVTVSVSCPQGPDFCVDGPYSGCVEMCRTEVCLLRVSTGGGESWKGEWTET